MWCPLDSPVQGRTLPAPYIKGEVMEIIWQGSYGFQRTRTKLIYVGMCIHAFKVNGSTRWVVLHRSDPSVGSDSRNWKPIYPDRISGRTKRSVWGN